MLCFFGGSDPLGNIKKLASIFHNRPHPWITFIAPKSDHSEIQAMLDFEKVKVLEFTPNLASQIQISDTVISAAGTSSWDLSTIGVPTAFICIAKNQKENFDSLLSASLGTGISLSDSEDVNYEKIREIVTSYDLRNEYFSNARKIFDGNGALNVVTSLTCNVNEY